MRDPMTRLKEETQEAHHAIENLMFGDKIRAENLELAEYRKLILTHFFVVEAVERALQQEGWMQFLAPIMYEKRRKSPALQADLQVLGISEPPNPFKIDFFKTAAQVLGALYVVEGSTLGGEIIHRKLLKSASLSTLQTFNYFGVYGNAIRGNWINFKNFLGENIHNPQELQLAVEAANKTFVLYNQAFSKLR